MVNNFFLESLSFLLGSSLGSFANVCIYRIPLKISVVTPRSFCPECGRTLLWYELVPVISFLFLRGRCRICDSRISLRYLFVELVSGTMAVFLFLHFGLTVDALVKFILFLLFVVIAGIDWTHLVIPDRLVVAGILVGVTALSFTSPHELIYSVVAAILATGFMFAARFLGNLAFKKETMGMGDVKLSGVIGLFVGVQYFLVAVWLAAVFGIVYWIFQRFLNQAKRDIKLPFGSFLSGSFLLIYFAIGPNCPLFHHSTIPWLRLSTILYIPSFHYSMIPIIP